MVRPRALAVLRLMTSANLVGCSTGRSAGLAPLRILAAPDLECRRSSRPSMPVLQEHRRCGILDVGVHESASRSSGPRPDPRVITPSPPVG